MNFQDKQFCQTTGRHVAAGASFPQTKYSVILSLSGICIHRRFIPACRILLDKSVMGLSVECLQNDIHWFAENPNADIHALY